MILSNRKLKLIIIALLLFIFATFLGMLSPKAEVITRTIYNTSEYVDTSANGKKDIDIIVPSSLQTSFNKNGTIIFNMGYKGNYLFVTQFEMLTNVGETVCDIGNISSFLDSNVQLNLVTLKCPYNANEIIVGFRVPSAIKMNNGSLYYGQEITFVDSSVTGGSGSSSDYSAALNAINSNINNIMTVIYEWRWSVGAQYGTLNDIKSLLTGNNTTITNIQNNVSDIKDTINDSSIDTNQTSTDTSSWSSMNASNGTITNLLTLPITLLQKIVSGLQTTCSPFSLGTLFETTITLPCINIGNLIGNGLWTTIDILFSGFMILAIAKKLIKIFNDFTNLKTNQIDEIYGGGSK